MAELLGQLGYPTDWHDIPARLAAVEHDGGAAFLVVDDGGRPVGLTCVMRYVALHAGGQGAYITALVADAGARGQGVGRALVNAAEAWAREHHCNRLTVTSAEHRADAHEFYPRCGMPYTGRRFSKRLD